MLTFTTALDSNEGAALSASDSRWWKRGRCPAVSLIGAGRPAHPAPGTRSSPRTSWGQGGLEFSVRVIACRKCMWHGCAG